MKLLATFVFVACSAVASSAFAQWGQPFDRFGLQHLDPTAISAEWRACTNEDYRFSAQEVIAGCSGAFEKATSSDERASALWRRALAYERAGELQSSTVDFYAALAEFDTWISDEPSLLEARFQRASLLISMREYDQALEAFEEVDRRRARQPNVRASIGRIAATTKSPSPNTISPIASPAAAEPQRSLHTTDAKRVRPRLSNSI